MVKKKAATGEQKKKFTEPKVKWKKSKARSLLYKYIVEGQVPPDATDANGRSTMQLRDVYLMHPEFAEYDYEKFWSSDENDQGLSAFWLAEFFFSCSQQVVARSSRSLLQ